MTITLSSRKAAFVIVAAVAVLLAYLVGANRPAAALPAAAAPVQLAASTASTSDGVTVTGSGTVSGTPDTLHLSLHVTGTGADVSTALARADASTKRVQDALTAGGVQAKDLQTSGLSIQPDYDNRGRPRGYRADESLTVTLRDLRTAGAAVTKAVAAGGNQVRVEGLSVGLDSTTALAAGARTRAVADAKARATQYAEAAGRSLGAVVSISESVQDPVDSPYKGAYATGASLAAQVPIQAGSQAVVVRVTVVYAFA